MLNFELKGSFDNTRRFFRGTNKLPAIFRVIFNRYAKQGLDALKRMTPKDTGLTADSWKYRLENWGIIYENTNIQNGVHVVLVIQYGHATRNGGYVPAVDFINPALRPIFDKISMDCWKEVQKL